MKTLKGGTAMTHSRTIHNSTSCWYEATLWSLFDNIIAKITGRQLLTSCDCIGGKKHCMSPSLSTQDVDEMRPDISEGWICEASNNNNNYICRKLHHSVY